MENEPSKTFIAPVEVFNKPMPQIQTKMPGFLGMQNLNAPVCFYQKIVTNKSVSDAIENITYALQHAGYKVSAMWGLTSTEGVKYINKDGISNPDNYIVHETKDGFIELITPFYPPQSARQDISKVIQTVAAVSDVSVVGAISPTYFYQIAPHTPRRLDNDGKMRLYNQIMEKYSSKGISIGDLTKKYQDSEEYLFRGHSFMYADENAPYATPSIRAGRTGKAYGTNDIQYALLYSGVNQFVASRSHLPNYLTFTDENGKEREKDIGFITVYKKAKNNLMFKNFGIENIDNNDKWHSVKNQLAGDEQSRETLLNKQENPIAETYFLSDKKAIKIDLKDPLWQEFVDCFAPDLEEMYNTDKRYIRKRDPNKEYGTSEYGQLYNLRLIHQKQVLDSLKNMNLLVSQKLQRAG